MYNKISFGQPLFGRMNVKHHKHGFTLIELLLSMSVIGILAAVLVPNLLQFRAKTNDAAASVIARQVITGMAALEVGGAAGVIVSGCSLSNEVVSFNLSSGISSIVIDASVPVNAVTCSQVAPGSGTAAKYQVKVDYVGGTVASKTLTSDK